MPYTALDAAAGNGTERGCAVRFQITTDYAIRIVLHMAQRGNEILGAAEAAEELGITYGYFNKVAGKIKRAGFLESIQGPGGGYRLAKKAADITLYDIVALMEGEISINRCLEKDGFCSRGAAPICPVHSVFESIQGQMIDTLRRTRVSDLCTKAQPEMAFKRELCSQY